MMISELRDSLEPFNDLATVLIQADDGRIHRLDSTHAIWVKSCNGTGIHGPFTETHTDAEDFGILLYG